MADNATPHRSARFKFAKIGGMTGRHHGRVYLIHLWPVWIHVRTAPFKAALRDGISIGRRPR